MNYLVVKYKMSKKIGCKHYNRGCSIVSPCCQKIFGCRLCHDETIGLPPTPFDEIHDINRHNIKEVICLSCNKQQQISQYCIGCGKCFGEYYCDVCNFFDNDVEKGIYHCDKCGICRVNNNKEYYHCDNCDQCLSIEMQDKHVCTSIKDELCPVCSEEIHKTVRKIIKNKCNHWIHIDCMTEMLKSNNYRCPLCSKSMIDLTEHNNYLDFQISMHPMPEECNKIVDILCHECNMKSNVNFHFYGNKCTNCGTYNTRMI